MGMTFGIGKDTVGTSSAQPRLKANTIHEVIFKGVSYAELKNKNDESNPYKVMKVLFANEDGVYEETLFAPKEGDDVRSSSKDTGKERPSNLERFKFTLAHIGEQLAPANYEKFKGMAFNLPEEFKKLVETFAKVVTPAVNKKTKLKLVANKKNEATLPFFVNLSKDGTAFVSNNWLGDKVFFSDYEVDQMSKQTVAKPSAMNDIVEDGVAEDATTSGANSDLDFDV